MAERPPRTTPDSPSPEAETGTEAESTDPEDPRIEDAAVAWYFRLREPEADAADRQAFGAWLAGDPRRRAAYDRFRRTWEDPALTEAAARLSAESLAPARFPRRGRRMVAAIAAVLLLALAAGLWLRLEPVTMLRADLRSGTGELRAATLPDGSRVTLDAGTALELAFTENQRRVRLLRGAAVFAVESDPARPAFTVALRHGRVEVTGTRFLVRRLDDGDRVGVLEGRVAVHAPGPAAAPLRLSRGEGALAGPDGAQREAFAARSALAWTRGRLVAEGMALAELLERLGRHTGQRYLVLDGAVARLEVTGTYDLTRPDKATAALSATLPVTLQPLPFGVTLVY